MRGPLIRSHVALAILVAVSTLVSPARAADGPAEPAPTVVLADGAQFAARLLGATKEPKWLLRFEVEGTPREVPVAELVRWGHFVEPAQDGMHVLLAGGGLIVATAVQSDGDRLQIETDRLGKVAVPLSSVAGVVLKPPVDRARRDALVAQVSTPLAQRDRLLLNNGDELSGTIVSLGPAGTTLETDGAKREIEAGRLTAVFYNPLLQARAGAERMKIVVGLDDGSRLPAGELAGDPRELALTLAGGSTLAVPTTAVVALQTLGGESVYLSDLKPASYRHLPFLQLTWPLAVDRSVSGGMLRADGAVYLKGLGMHSPARVTYELEGAYRRFSSEVAVDAETGAHGSVVFRVYLDDGSGRWREAAASETVRGGESPATISVDLAGAKRISLLVDYADHGDELDHADWLDPHLVK